MRILPLLLSALAALAVGPGLRRGLLDGGHTVRNYRDEQLACPLGIIIVAAVAITAGLIGAMHALNVTHRGTAPALEFVAGVAALGLFDDAYGGPSRGWRGHGRAVLSGGLPTGAVKAIGTLGLAGWVASTFPLSDPTAARWLGIVAVLVLATNLFNILDLRPGRTVKAFVLLAIGLMIAKGTRTLEGMGLYAGAIVAVGAYDVRERGMLGDTGANLVGAVAGVWLVGTITSTGGLWACAAILAAITAYGEFRSISAFIERTPGLRHLDSVGRIQTREDAAA